MKRTSFTIVLLALVLTANGSVTSQDTPPLVELATVTNIVDGDTIDVQFEDGTTQRVRYIGINTPESNETCGSEATQANSVIFGQTVAMRRDVSETDQFGRLLRYVYADGFFVNAALVAEGWAEAVDYPPDTAFAEWFAHLEEQAREENKGCHAWGAFGGEASAQPTSTPTASVGVAVTSTESINLRSGPSTDYPVQATLVAGQTVRAIGRNAAGDWLLLESGGWVATWVVTVQGDVFSLPPTAPPPPDAQPALPTPQYVCDCGKTCGAMSACEEAYFQLNQCGCSRRDGDGDGVPCESICPGG